MVDEPSQFFYCRTARRSGVAEGRVVRQVAVGHEYAHVRVSVDPLPRGSGNQLAWRAGWHIPARFVQSVMEGTEAALTKVAPGRLPFVDILASVESGSYHESDSNESAFREAAEDATEQALRRADPILLEAVLSITVSTQEEFTGAVQALVISCDEIIQAISAKDRTASVTAEFAASKVYEFISEVLRNTQGTAKFSMSVVRFIESADGPPGAPDDWAAFT